MDTDTQDYKHTAFALGSVFSWFFGHSTEIGFAVATTVSFLTMIYLVQGIILRNKEIYKPKND